MSIKSKLLEIKERINMVKEYGKLDDKQMNVIKQINDLKKASTYQEATNVVSALQQDPNWKLMDYKEILGGMGEADIEYSYEFLLPSVKQGLKINLNSYAQRYSITSLTARDLRRYELKEIHKDLVATEGFENILATKSMLDNSEEWSLIVEPPASDGIYIYYSDILCRGITIDIDNETKTAKIESTHINTLTALLYGEDSPKR